MAIADELIGILGYKLEGTENLAKYQQGLDDAEKGAQASVNRIKGLGIAAGAVATAGIAVTTAAVKDFAAFEREMTRIGITAGATVDETTKASEVVQRLAKDYALPIDQAVAGLDTLVASGKSLQEAMAFLPSVLATAQASGSATVDIANTAQKAAGALKLQADELQRAFDIMVSGGKAGQFELKDMATYIPELANSFASLGYQGEDGLKRLVAMLQTLREDTGSAGAAATQAQNIFGKMFSEETSNRFKKFGIDLRAEMEAAKAAGEDAVSAFVRLSKQAIDGDLSKLPTLFSDQEFRLGMQSLITSQESFDKFLAAVNGAEIDGTVFRDLGRVLGDTQAQMDRMSSSWDRFMKSLGSAAADPVGGVLDVLSNDLDKGEAVRRQLEKEGLSYWQREAWLFKNTFDQEEIERKARQGGYVPAGDEPARVAKETAPYAYEVLGRLPERPRSTAHLSQKADAEDRKFWDEHYGGQEQRMLQGFPEVPSEIKVQLPVEQEEPTAAPAVKQEVEPIEIPFSFQQMFQDLMQPVKAPSALASQPGIAVPEQFRDYGDTGLFPKAPKITGDALNDFTAAVNRSTAALNASDLQYPDRTVGGVSDVRPMPTGPVAGNDTRMAEIAARLDGMNAHLAQMTGNAPLEAVITDARQDNRQFPVNSSVVINQTVNEAQAPMAAAQATASATTAAVQKSASSMPARAAGGASTP